MDLVENLLYYSLLPQVLGDLLVVQFIIHCRQLFPRQEPLHVTLFVHILNEALPVPHLLRGRQQCLLDLLARMQRLRLDHCGCDLAASAFVSVRLAAERVD